MDLGTASAIVDRIHDQGRHTEEDIHLYDGEYSGRSMYGKKTAAIVIDNITMLYDIGMAAEQLRAETEDPDEPYEVPTSLRMDNLGRGYVVY